MGQHVLDDRATPLRHDVVVLDAETFEELEELDEVEFDALGVSEWGGGYLLSM